MTSPRTPKTNESISARGRRIWGRSHGGSKVGLIGLSAAAILSVYAVGYFETSATDSAGPAIPEVALDASPVPTSGPTRSGNPTARPQPSPSPVTTPKGPATATYRDGTYIATGTSRHGSISVAVVVGNGQITSAEITSCQTRYPCSKVARLPGQVVARQSATVSYVSGATDSSKAYSGAVAAALAKAGA